MSPRDIINKISAILIFGFLSIVLFPSSALSDIWKYTDADGREWFVNSQESIPGQYLEKSQKVVSSSVEKKRPKVRKRQAKKPTVRKTQLKKAKKKKKTYKSKAEKTKKKKRSSSKKKSKYNRKGS